MAIPTPLLPARELLDRAVTDARRNAINWDRPRAEIIALVERRRTSAVLEGCSGGVVVGMVLGVFAALAICIPFGIYGMAVMACYAACALVLGVITGRWIYNASTWSGIEVPEDLSAAREQQAELCEVRSCWEGDRFVRYVLVDGNVVWQHQEAVTLTPEDGLAQASTWMAGDEYVLEHVKAHTLPATAKQLSLSSGIPVLAACAQ
jgi:hypothetical protein